MKKIVPEYSFSEEQLNIIGSLAKETGLTTHTVRILYARGVDTVEKIRKFMNPSKKNFLSPFLMKGMSEAVAVLETARDEGKVVAVFGDYDADGICASTIMYYALSMYGIEAHVYVPERSDGYGLNEDAIDKIFEECQPEIFLTVDCGISCAKEAQYIYELGADVIITDHHELPETLPDCIIVNPKLKDDYPYDNLCGAGVAFKLACALIGERAYSLLDFATLATVADSVPLVGENRDIVTEGLKLFNSPEIRLCFKTLLGKNAEDVTAQTLAFNLAPRINAAGRMGDAQTAFELFIAEDDAEILDKSARLISYNMERQKYCDDLYNSAKEQLKKKGAYGKVIMLSDDSWNSGFVGIVAAKIAEEFARPTILFVKNGDMLKGSARSIESINIYNALKNCSEYITEFGGHAQAAGVNIRAEDFDKLEQALNNDIENTYSRDDFEQRVYVAEELTEPFSEEFAHEIARLEPFGVGHRKPLFSVAVSSCEVKPLKPLSPHVSIKNPYIDMIYFSGAKNIKLIESDVSKNIVFEVMISKFRGKESIKGNVKEIVYNGFTGKNASTGIFANNLEKLRGKDLCKEVEYLTTSEIKDFIKEKSAECSYGLCLIASDRRTASNYDNLSSFGCDLFIPSSRNVANTLIISPSTEAELSGFNTYVFLDTPSNYYLKGIEGKKVYANKEISGSKPFTMLDTSRETLLEIYSSLRRESMKLTGINAEEICINCGALGYSEYEFIFALYVFEDLGILSYNDNKVTLYRGVKAELKNSVVYEKVCELIENN